MKPNTELVAKVKELEEHLKFYSDRLEREHLEEEDRKRVKQLNIVIERMAKCEDRRMACEDDINVLERK